MPSAPLPRGVALTAIGAARGRATESARPDRLADDPFAAQFVAAAASFLAPDDNAASTASTTGATAGVDVQPLIDAYVGVRTPFFDTALLDAARDGIRQIVILGAGLDTRAFRFDWPAGTRLFEVDTEDIFQFKEPVLAAAQPRCERITVAVDLRDDWPAALGAAHFDQAAPTAWLLEGLLVYLPEADRDLLLRRIGELSAPRSRMALEPPGWTVPSDLAPTVARARATTTLMEELVTAGQTGSDPSVTDPSAWLANHGWRATLVPATELFSTYGRVAPEPLRTLRRYVATAERTPLRATSLLE